jgi:hypothetical protein
MPTRTRTTKLVGRCRSLGTRAAVALAAIAFCAPRSVAAQAEERLPFAPGERLTYAVRLSKLGVSGKGTMTVEAGPELRGRETVVLRFEVQARLGLVKVSDRTESWLDARRMAALRYHKRERRPLAGSDEAVEMFPDERRWRSEDGNAGESPTDAPLDELSFIYFVRTLPLEVDSVYRFDRHFDSARNPVTVRVLGRGTVETPAGSFRTLRVEMRVNDARRYHGEGVIRLDFTDDASRIPVRIESAIPIAGTAVLSLESFAGPAPHTVARAP